MGWRRRVARRLGWMALVCMGWWSGVASAGVLDDVLRTGPDHVRSVLVSGLDKLPEPAVRYALMVDARDVFDSDAVAADVERLRSLGVFDSVRSQVRHTANGVDVTYRVRERRPLPRIRLDGVRVEGNKDTDPAVVRQELRLGPGDMVSWETLAVSMREVAELRLFSRIGYRFQRDDGEGLDAEVQAVTLVVEVREGFMRFGFVWPTYSSDNPDLGGIGPVGGYIDRNFMGTGSQLYVGGIWAETRVLGVGAAIPHAFGTDGHMAVFAAYADQTQEVFDRDAEPTGDEYRAELAAGGAYWRQPLDVNEYWNLGAGLGYVRGGFREESGPAPAADGEGPVLVGSIGHDRRDDPAEPTAGYYAGVRVDLGYQFSHSPESDRGFVRVNPQVQKFFRLGRRHTAAFMVRGGIASRDVPFLGEFTLGGQSSMRGYPSGGMRGDTYVWGVGEYRFPVLELRDDRALTGVLFVEAGDAWDRGSDDAPFQWRRSGGLGVRVIAGAFIVRADYAVSPVADGFYVFLGHYF
jgi:outer membrane protein assembly factor BamA